jgi:hypothetical protein
LDPEFIPGLVLSERFYREVVEPILTDHFPELVYSAALMGSGSEVLGFDTPLSMDHDWGPRLLLFLSESNHKTSQAQIHETLRHALPDEIHGYPSGFRRHEDGTRVMTAKDGGPVNHGVELLTVRHFFTAVLGFDPTGEITAVDWVRVPQYRLLMLTAGRVYHDGLRELVPLRKRLRYYPHEVWLYLLAVQWRRIAQEEAFMGRCGQAGDDLGSRLIAARLIRDLMGLCFLMERRYAPYIKWFGSAFAELKCAGDLLPPLRRVLEAATWQERQRHLVPA